MGWTTRDQIFETSFDLRLPLAQVFHFFADAGNLERITPDKLSFQIVSPQPIEMRDGALIDYRLSLMGVPFTWRTRITRWDPPRQFEDTQLAGPYRKWVHTHSFSEHDGLTTISDRVVYQLPFWPLGQLGLPFVRRQVRQIFRFREQAIRAWFQQTEAR